MIPNLWIHKWNEFEGWGEEFYAGHVSIAKYITQDVEKRSTLGGKFV